MITESRTVLIAEDDTLQRIVLSQILMAHHFEVVEAEDGARARGMLQTSHRNQYDFLISDYQMPHLNGMSLIQWCRSHADWYDLPIILTSATTTEQQAKFADTMADVVFMPKPIEAGILIPVLTGRNWSRAVDHEQ